MTRLIVETTPMLRDLMVAALAARGISRETVEFRCRGEQEKGRAPVGVFIQQGGMVALAQAGIDVEALALRGTTITRVAILDETATRVILEYSPALAGAGPLPIFLPLADVREVVASAAAPAPPINETHSQSNDSATAWTSVPCPGTLARVVAGRISNAGRVVLWTGPRVHVGVAPLPGGQLFLYAVARQIGNKDEQRRQCVAALDEVPARLTSELDDFGHVIDETWFPFERLGYRLCQSRETNVLRWGSFLLRLHPLTGQHLSYWAIQSVRLAENLAQNGSSSREFFAQLDRDNARMHQQHMRAIGFHLAPSWFWRTLRWPYAVALRAVPRLRHRAVRRLALLDFLPKTNGDGSAARYNNSSAA